MSATGDALSTVRLIYRKLTGRAGKLILLVLLALPVAAWCTLRVSMAIQVWRANALLLRIKQLRARQSTFEDAMRLARQYAGHVDYWGEACSPRICNFRISLGYGWDEPPPFISRMHILRAAGIRVSRFGGWVQVRDDRVIGKGFAAWTEARKPTRFGDWLVVLTQLTDHFHWCDYTRGWQLGLEEHPNRYVQSPALSTTGGGQMLEAEVTPDATAREIERAFDFRLSCISSLAGCSELGDLLPTAWEDYVAWKRLPHQGADDRNYGPCPLRSLARLARDMDNVVLVKVKRVFPLDRHEHRSQDVEFQLVEILKGQPDKHLPRFPMDIGGDDGRSGHTPIGLPPKVFSPGKRIVLFLKNSELDYVPYPHCEVVPATQENLGIVRQTLTQLSQGAPLSALREVNELP